MDRRLGPMPDFYPCNTCELPGACKAARHCAHIPRTVQQPQPIRLPAGKEKHR
jgi:hypothetical protein